MAFRRPLFPIALLVAALIAPAGASADRLSCGAVVVSDTVLRTDVTGCAGTALVIAADGVTLDLDGHTVDGSILASGHADVEVRDGVVTGDVSFDGVRRASVKHLRVREGSIACIRSAGCAIVQNALTGGGVVIADSEIGVPNRIRANVVRSAPGAGIAADRVDTTTITANVVRGSATGIESRHAADIRIARNVIVDNDGNGLTGSFGAAATIVRNFIASNGGDGIALRMWGGETLIARNVAFRNGGSGIFGAAVSHWTVIRNLAARNAEAGIAIAASVDSTTLTLNRARRNGGLGIDADRGVTDGGGNRARANGAPAQCAGIACR